MKKNIILGKDKILNNYFIDENAVITDKDGVIQSTYLHNNRPTFKLVHIHRIMMYTFYEFRDGHKWVIHHIDENKFNNKLSNLVYITRSEHTRLHSTGHKGYWLGKKHTIETKRKMSKAQKNKVFSEETRKKLSEAAKRRIYPKDYRRKLCDSHKA